MRACNATAQARARCCARSTNRVITTCQIQAYMKYRQVAELYLEIRGGVVYPIELCLEIRGGVVYPIELYLKIRGGVVYPIVHYPHPLEYTICSVRGYPVLDWMLSL